MMNLRCSKRFVRGESGAAMVEFAILLPVLLLIILGILQFGLMFYTKYVITAASREGARYATIYTADDAGSRIAPCNITNPKTVQQVVQDYCDNLLFNSSVNFEPGGPGWASTASGLDVTITVSCQNPWDLLGGFIPSLSNLTLQAQTTMKCE